MSHTGASWGVLPEWDIDMMSTGARPIVLHFEDGCKRTSTKDDSMGHVPQDKTYLRLTA